MIVKSEGLVLRKIPHKEKSVVVHILTREYGKLGFLVRGMNSKNSKAALYQPGMLLDLVFYKSHNQGLATVKEATPISRSALSPLAGMLQQIMVEMVIKSVQEEQADPMVFDYLKKYFLALPTAKATYFLHAFSIGLSSELGCAIPLVAHQNTAVVAAYEGMILQNTKDRFTSEDILALEQIENGKNPELNRQQRGLLLHKILKYFSLHLTQGKEILGLKVLEQLL